MEISITDWHTEPTEKILVEPEEWIPIEDELFVEKDRYEDMDAVDILLDAILRW